MVFISLNFDLFIFPFIEDMMWILRAIHPTYTCVPVGEFSKCFSFFNFLRDGTVIWLLLYVLYSCI